MNNPYKIIKFDKYTGKIDPPTLLLMNRSFHIIGKISRYENWNISLVGNGMDEISFDVHKYTDGILCPVWDGLIDLKIVDVKGFGKFEISVNYTDNTETVKSVHGFSLETELAQIGLYEFHVNDEEDIENSDGNFIPTVFYNPEDKEHSLLHRVLADKAPHWGIGHVTPYIALDEKKQRERSSTFQRTYTVDGDTIYDFLTGTVSEESNVIFTFGAEYTQDSEGNGGYRRTINCYSLCDCIDQETGNIHCGIGEDTSVFISKNKLANEITVSSNKDNVKNCFRIEGGDDVITDMVRAVNMNGSNYIYQFADFQYQDMSEGLRKKIEDYQADMSKESTQNEYYGNGDIDNFLNDKLTLKVSSELEAASVMNICGNNKIKTGSVTIRDCASAKYWYIAVSGGTKELRTSTTVRYPYKTVKAAINSMGIYPRLCNAYDKLAYFESSMMPNTGNVTEVGTAEEQYNKVFSELNRSVVAVSLMNKYNNNLFVGVTNNIEAYAQIFLDSRFDLEIVDGTTSYSYTDGTETGTWKGKIRITQHTDESNTYPVDPGDVSELEVIVNDDRLEFAKQKVYKALSKASLADIDFEVTGMGKDDVRNYFNQYSLNRLQSFSDAYNSCISILAALGQATTSEVKNNLYDTYLQRYEIVESVKEERQKQVNEINGEIENIQTEQKEFQTWHDFQTHLGEYYLEFCAYRREDTYSNSNYISDGLTTSECLAKAKELIEVATKEAKKACVLQRTVSTSMNNLFAIPEFEPLYDKFALYNYIRIRTEDEILKLRLIGIEFSGDSPEDIEVTFSEQIESIDGTIDDLKSIIQQASAMATSYSSTALQAKQGSEAKNTVLDMYNHGLNAAKTMLTNNDNNEVTITPSGILCKRMDDEGFYGKKQLLVTGNIMAFTTDNWNTIEMAIGETSIQNPFTGETENGYGIIANNIIGNMMASNKLLIGNEEGSVLITGDGIIIEKGTISWGKDNVNPPEISDINGLNDFKRKVNAALTGSETTEIGSDYIISPKIGGGYLYIEDKRSTANKTGLSVEINPNGTDFAGHKKAYVFNISNGDDLIMGVNNDGNGYFSGEIEARNGAIGGWNIDNGLISSEGSNGIISLDSGTNTISSKLGNNEVVLKSDYLGFRKGSIQYVKLHTVPWKDKSTVFGVGINSEADSKFISFGNKKLVSDDTYITPLVLNYGLNPNNDTQDVLIYGTTLITEKTTLRNELYFNNSYYLRSWNDKNGNVSGVGCNGSFSTIGTMNVGNTDYGSKLNVNGSGYINGNLQIVGDLIADGSYNNEADSSTPNVRIGNAHKIRKTSGSSRRFKDDIKLVDSEGLNPNKLYGIDVVQYKFKKDYLAKEDQRYNKDVIGFIAEDVYEKYPIAADYSVDEEGNTVVEDWNFRYIVPAMLKLIQEQKEKIDSLERRLAKSEQEIEGLKPNK